MKDGRSNFRVVFFFCSSVPRICVTRYKDIVWVLEGLIKETSAVRLDPACRIREEAASFRVIHHLFIIVLVVQLEITSEYRITDSK